MVSVAIREPELPGAQIEIAKSEIGYRRGLPRFDRFGIWFLRIRLTNHMDVVREDGEEGHGEEGQVG
jgi:hypothetical protein